MNSIKTTTSNTHSALPKGWRWVRLGEVCEVSSGSSAPQEKKYFEDGKHPFVRVQDLGRVGRTTNLVDIKDHVNDLAVKELNLIKAEKGTILFPKSGAAITTNSRAILGMDAFIVSHLAAIKPKENLADTYFIYYLLYQIDMVQYMENPGYPSLKLSTICQICVPLPPLDEQKRIATKLQELMQEVRNLQSAVNNQNDAAKVLPSAYLRQVFESEEAKKWERKRLGEVLEIIESGSRPKGGVFEIKEGIPSIGAEHLNSFGGFNFDNTRFIPKEFYLGMNRGRIQEKDVLVVKDGATTGKVSFIGDNFPYSKAAINEHVFRLRGKNFIEQEFLFWFLYSPLGQQQIQNEFHGSAQGGINQQFVKGVYIPVLPIDIQRQIVDELKQKMTEAEKLQASIEKQLEAINAIPQLILRKAFRGEL